MPESLTARQVVGRIRAGVGGWVEPTVDVFKAGDPDRPVTGVATTWMSTSYAIQAAAEAGCNFLVTHEPTFWNHQDTHHDWFAADPTYQAKVDLIDRTGVTIWRFHDNNHAGFDPDPVLWTFLNMIALTGISKGDSPFSWQGQVPRMSLKQFAEQVARCLHTTNVRVVGDENLTVHTIGIGAHNLDTGLDANHGAEAVLIGETREWDTFEYYRDAALLGIPRGLVVISHRDLETWASTVLANWLALQVPELKVVAIDSLPPFQMQFC